MLPFLHNSKRVVDTILSKRGEKMTPVKSELNSTEDGIHPGLKAAAEDLMAAVHDRSVVKVSQALRAAHAILGSTGGGDEGMI